MRGLMSFVTLSWPPSNIGAGADYSVDFSAALCGGEYVVSGKFGATDCATQAWASPSIFGNIVTMWLSWTASGNITVPVAVITNTGNVYQVDVGISLSSEAALLTPVPPEDPNGGAVVNGAVLSRSGSPIATRSGAYLAFR